MNESEEGGKKVGVEILCFHSREYEKCCFFLKA